MQKPSILLPLLLLLPATLAALNGRCTGSKATGQYKESGICINTSTCKKYKGTTKDGACPYDPDDVKCCLIDNCAPSPDGDLGPHSYCEWTSDKDSICNQFGVWFNSMFPQTNLKKSAG